MIRPLKKEDVDEVLKIWLFASLISHNRIEQNYWISQLDFIRDECISSDEIYVYEQEDTHEVIGFFSLRGNELTGIGIAPYCEGKGLGRTLIDYAKSLRDELVMNLFEHNTNSLAFLEKMHFRIVGERMHPVVQCKELILKYSSIG